MVCLLLTLRMAHKSLMLKLEARKAKNAQKPELQRQRSASTDFNKLIEFLNDDTIDELNCSDRSDKSDTSENTSYENVEMKTVDYDENDQIIENTTNFSYKRPKTNFSRSNSVISLELDTRVDKIYTVGCFDLFHHGHVKLIQRMREFGKKVIIGVHDSRRLVETFHSSHFNHYY